MKLRDFQDRLLGIASAMSRGERDCGLVTADVTPAGGKTHGARVFAKQLLEAGVVDRVVWLVPRLSLVSQVASRTICGRALRANDNTTPPSRGNQVGYVATFDSLASLPELHEDYASKHRVLLVVDEFHHLTVEDDGSEESFHAKAVGRIDKLAVVVLAMSGTRFRHDKKRIKYVTYDEAGNAAPADVTWTHDQAVDAGDKVPVRVEWIGADTTWLNEVTAEDAKCHTTAPDPRIRPFTWSLVGGLEYVLPAIEHGLASYMNYRTNHPWAQCLLVARDQVTAKAMLDHAISATRGLGLKIELAVSDTKKDGKRAIRRFCQHKVDVLVTVGMAYEGLDSPPISHIVCLRGFKSAPWLDQCRNRGSRNFENKVCCWIFLPDTEETRRAWEEISVQDSRCPAREPEDCRDTPGSPASAGANLAAWRLTGASIGDQVSLVVIALRKRFPWAEKLSDEEVLDLSRAISPEVDSNVSDDEESEVDPGEEDRIRSLIQREASMRDYRLGLEPGSTNRALRGRFRKSRERMGTEELREVLRYLGEIASSEAA